MKSYIVFTNKGMIATEANNKKSAFEKVSSAFTDRKVSKSNVTVSSCHASVATCEKL